jgi:uncharacterized protein (DUF2141 family)
MMKNNNRKLDMNLCGIPKKNHAVSPKDFFMGPPKYAEMHVLKLKTNRF